MSSDSDIIQCLVNFLLQPDRTVPSAITQCLQNSSHLQNRFIATFFAKTLAYLQSHSIAIFPTNQTSLPRSVYYGVIHPSSIIRNWCQIQIESVHKTEITDEAGKKIDQKITDSQSSLVLPVFNTIQRHLSFMEYTVDGTEFDQRIRNVEITQSAIGRFLSDSKPKNGTAQPRNLQCAECHLFSGLRLLVEVLSSTALDAIVQSGDLKGLWDILLNRLDLSEDPLILADCTVVLEHLLRCPSRQKLWGPNLDSNHFTLKCV